MPDQLSSSLTFFYKIIFPSVWLTGFSAGSVAMCFVQKAPAIAFTCATMMGFFFLRWVCFPLKQVRQGGDEVFVRYADIACVTENKFINLRPITISLRQPCRFGTKIKFMPYWQFSFAFWKDHPVTNFLQSRIPA